MKAPEAQYGLGNISINLIMFICFMRIRGNYWNLFVYQTNKYFTNVEIAIPQLEMHMGLNR